LFFGAAIGWAASTEMPRAEEIVETPVVVPNGSFESPTTTYAWPPIDFWQKTPKPSDFDESQGYPWEDETGLFLNPQDGAPDHIINCDLRQALFLFSYPGVGLFQDYDSIGDTSTTPDHRLDVRFEPNHSYRLTVGVIGGPGSQLKDGTTLQLELYYRDNGTNLVTVVSNTIAHSIATFPDHIQFRDFTVESTVVTGSDPWAGKHLGIRLLSTTTHDLLGGYWDLDNVRLTVRQHLGPTITLSPTANGYQLSWPVTPGCVYQPQTSKDLTSWSDLGPSLSPQGGIAEVLISEPDAQHAFYRVLVLPKN
jgi:hypothetical protein